MAEPVLSTEEVREHIRDVPEANHLLDGEEFSNTRITLAMNIAIDKFNMFTPRSATNIFTFPSKYLLLYGTLGVMFEMQSALLARNTLSYSDGGIQIPVEERMQLYQSLAQMYNASFESQTRSMKIQDNIDGGWGSVPSDYSYMPLW